MVQRVRVRVLWATVVASVAFAAMGGLAWAGSSSDHAALVGATTRMVFGSAPAFSSFDLSVSCLSGERATGGGVHAGTATTLVSSFPLRGDGPVENGETADGWGVTVVNNTFKPAFTNAYVICAGP